ncbi:MAG: radical SAM/SPASM domain-containing protein [Nitrospirota bacterium]
MKINHDISRVTPINKTVQVWLSQRSVTGYLCNRIEWYCCPHLSIVKEYPIHIDIELSSVCQLRCSMCFRFHKPVKNQGLMHLGTFKKIIDEIEGKVYSIKFTGRGEPLMNRQFPQFMEYVKDRSFGEITMITNGQLMNDEIMMSMIECGMDRVAFSIDGLKDKYEEIRAPIKYEEILDIVTRLYDLRNKKGRKKPHIRIQGVKTSIDEDREFLNIWGPLSDEVLFLEYKDYSIEAESQPQAGYRCPSLYQRIMVHWDGTVPMCINDEYEESVMGSVLQDSVKEIWKSAAFDQARRVHRENMRGVVYKNCSKCALHREGHGKKSGALSTWNLFG